MKRYGGEIQMCPPTLTLDRAKVSLSASVTVAMHIYYKKGHLGPLDFVTIGVDIVGGHICTLKHK